jgi:hypothetical protein
MAFLSEEEGRREDFREKRYQFDDREGIKLMRKRGSK